MPFKPVRVDGGWKVQDDQGRVYSEKPLSRRAAIAQMRALYANDPGARKEADEPAGSPILFTKAELDQIAHETEQRTGKTAVEMLNEAAAEQNRVFGNDPYHSDASAEKEEKPNRVVLRPVITTNPSIAERFLKLLASLSFNSKAGHTANFAMFLDGDGNDQPFDVEGVDLPKHDEKGVDIIQAERSKEVAAVPTGVNAGGPGGLMGVMGMGSKRWGKKGKKKEIALKHLPGQHNQADHARGRRAGAAAPKPAPTKPAGAGPAGPSNTLRAPKKSGAKPASAKKPAQADPNAARDAYESAPHRRWMRDARNRQAAQGAKKPAANPKTEPASQPKHPKTEAAISRMENKLNDARDTLAKADAYIAKRGDKVSPDVLRERNELRSTVDRLDKQVAAARQKFPKPEAKPAAGKPAAKPSSNKPKKGSADKPDVDAKKPKPEQAKKPEAQASRKPQHAAKKPMRRWGGADKPDEVGAIDRRLNEMNQEASRLNARMKRNTQIMNGQHASRAAKRHAMDEWKRDYQAVFDMNKRAKKLIKDRARLTRGKPKNIFEAILRGLGLKEVEQAEKELIQQEALEVLLDAGAEYQPAASSLSVFKDAKGQYRWVLFSSNAFRDRDKEIVSTKALEADVARSDESEQYGPLRWWHLSDPPVDLGACDFRMVHDRVLIESGTFKSEAIGAAVKEAAPRLQVSIGFNHPKTDPDPDGVYHVIRTFERSLLPQGRAANPFTKVFVKGDDAMATKEEKLAALQALGIDPKAILGEAEATAKELENAGVAFKEGEVDTSADAPASEAEKESTETTAGAPDETLAEKAKGKKKPEPEPEADDAEEPDGDEAEEDEEEYLESDEEDVIGNMSVESFKEMIAKAVKEGCSSAMEPMTKMLHTHDSKKEEAERQKEAEEQTRIKEALAAQNQAVSALQQQLAASQAAMEATQKALKEAADRLAELEGSTPRALKGYVASQAEETEIDAERAKELGAPGADKTAASVNQFMGWLSQ